MIIYIKNDNGTINTISIEAIIHELTSIAHHNEINPYLIGYVADFKNHFIFTTQQDELRRFGIRYKEKTYFPLPVYHAYDKKNRVFSITPHHGRLSENRDFTLPASAFLTPEEAETFSSYKGFWQRPVRSADAELDPINDAIFRFMHATFGITTRNDDEFKTLLRAQLQRSAATCYRKKCI